MKKMIVLGLTVLVLFLITHLSLPYFQKSASLAVPNACADKAKRCGASCKTSAECTNAWCPQCVGADGNKTCGGGANALDPSFHR